jgi:uncharacterized protein (DUF2126 family)/transglutaminase-like putative cysteine protease
MSIHVGIHHKTSYKYDKPVSMSPHIVRLRPAPHSRTPILSYSLKILPQEHYINWQQDPYGNYQARLVFPKKVTEFVVEVDVVADMVVVDPFDFFLDDYADKTPFSYEGGVKTELIPYLEIKENSEHLLDYVSKIRSLIKPQRTVDFLVNLNMQLYNDVKYIIRMEPGVQTCEETLTLKKGSCRDSAWLMVQVLRHLGFAARFMSGYLVQLVPDVKSLDGPSGPLTDFTDLHAWTEVYLPGAGWVGLDPTSGLFAGEGHIPLAGTPDPSSAAPITGLVDDCEVEFLFDMSIKRIDEIPRVTKPYSDEEWIKVNTLGRRIDSDLQKKDVRLTMGGEPTFVSMDDMDGAEWNTEALGPTKKKYALELFHRLIDKFSFKPLLHFGQGKWYPGEPLPRWNLTCYWRKDGEGIWRNPALYGDERISCNYTQQDAQKFIIELTKRLAVSARHIVPGFEDLYYYLWKEGTLPVNVNPFKVDLKDDLERKTLRSLLERDLRSITGYALPIRWNYEANTWESGSWFFKRDVMYLLPGNSPMGFRLPLKSIPHSDGTPYTEDISNFETREPLGDIFGKVQKRYNDMALGKRKERVQTVSEQIVKEDFDAIIRTALCVEAREGNIYVFMPPLVYLDQYLDMISTVEDTASALGYKVIIEGYNPPNDQRIEKFSISPDPGVIEVNIHPSRSWEELVDKTEILYEEARLSRLRTEKFMLDGKHTGTGGGNHITIGGLTPADSPLLRRPDLLKSFLGYWINHPGLSYLFSTLFIGPTSQAPRVDEARVDQVFELEIAFNELDKYPNPPFWVVDRIFRNILTDLTGNTHRAEFCIDKLYSPDSSYGRLGILELRNFEMPPHARMSMAQGLLVRGLISMFWDKPYKQKLVRWGTQLHDKFMLPHFVWSDFTEVLEDLNKFGYEFNTHWFDAFYNFRFPLYGQAQFEDVRIELRGALEPWNVLGEEAAAGGTARYVDSSPERLEIKVFGMTDPRHILVCNGRPVPLRSTGTHGEFVSGVKYKAWNPYSALHPTIGATSSIVVDLVDTWNNRSVGGCTYYISHPGGRNNPNFPVNSNSAESRLKARFQTFGHTPGKIIVDPPITNPEFPYTLDLRR